MRAIPAHRRRSGGPSRRPSVPRATTAAICAFLIFAATTPADAELAFRGPSSLFATGSTPSSVAIADLDRDGKADLVVTNSAVFSASRISSISILRGKGDGTFEPHHVIPVGNVPQAVVIEDLDGDGLLDLAISNFGEIEAFLGSVSVLLGNGDGTFRSPTDYPAGDKVRSLSAADLDGDGDLDLVTEDAVLLGNGDGTFYAAAFRGDSNDWHVAVDDLNRDGHLDLVTSNVYAEPNDEDDPWLRAYAVRLGNGDGTFQEPIRQGTGFRCYDVEIADLDGDALLDLVLCNHGDDRGAQSGVLVHLGRGDGTFGTGRLFPTAINPVSVAVADLNDDGKLDLVAANHADDPDFGERSLTILLGNGDGTFERRPELQIGEGPFFVAAGRVDANATQDLIAVNQYSSTVSIFLGNGDGTFGTPDLPMRRPPLGLAAADFDRDGRRDLVMTMGGPYSGPGGGVILGHGDGTFGDLLDSSPTTSRGFVGTTELNGDLAQDLVFITATGMSAMLGNGDATFRASFETSLLPTQTPGIPAFADFDRDGRIDVAVPLNYEADAVAILLGRGDGTFESSVRVPTGRAPQSAAAGDMNGDGVPDLVLGHDGYVVSVRLGLGDGSFAPQVLYDAGNYFSNAGPTALADLDSDGRLDVVSGNNVWMGNGDGTLRRGVSITLGGEMRGVVLEDLDGDRHVDLAYLFGGEDRIVSVYPGNGDGTFGARLDYGTGAWPRSMTTGDFDGDGRTDIAVANSGSQSISILLNRSEAPVVPVRFVLRPAVVNPRSEARWITGVLELAAPHSVADIDVSSIRLNGVVPVDAGAPGSQGRHGPRELLVRFDRASLAAALPAGDQVPVTVTGTLGGDSFAGSTTVRVLGRGVGPATGTPRRQLALRILPPPRAAAGALRLDITLADEAAARLDVIDVAGRVVATRSLESLGAGPHEVELASPGTLAPGIYFVRLRQGAQLAHARAAVLR